MRNEPKSNQLELEKVVRFSLGIGTRITSVNVKLSDIRQRDLPPEYKEDDGPGKREFAEMVAMEEALRLHKEKWAEEPDGAGEPITYMTTHREDSVTFEIWKHGPERRQVKLI